MLPRRLLACVVSLGLLSTLSYITFAGPTDSLKPAVFAVKDARVVTDAGKVLPKATVVIRDGVIEAVGADVKPPADALVTDGTGLTVYPGFLDAMSNWGYDNALRRSEGGPPAPEDLAAEALATTKPDNRKGITPEFQVRTAIKSASEAPAEEPAGPAAGGPPAGRRGAGRGGAGVGAGRGDEDPADNWRKVGFTAHLIAPEGGVIVGQSALVSLSGATSRDSVLRAPVALHAALRQVQGGSDYPRALMGVVAHARQTFLDAGWYARTWAAFEQGGGVGKRPPLDPALAALGPALEGKVPVVFEADTRDEIHRALDFAAEFHLKPILYGGRDAAKVVDRLKAENVPVLLRVAYSEGAPRRRFGFGPPPAAGAEETPPEDDPTPARAKADRERKQKEEAGAAAALHKAGVRFAFSTQGLGNGPFEKFRTNVRKAVDAGLSPDAALRALTSDAAQILGVDRQLGTITPGKAAHVIVTDGDFLAEKTQVRYVFADGVRFEYEKGDDRAADGKRDFGKRGRPGKGGEKREEKEADKGDAKKTDKQAEIPTEIEADRHPKTHTGGNVLIRGATVLTVTKGTLPETDILVKGGKIEAIGKKLEAPAGVKVIDAKGMFVMPGVIDTHCHFAVSGGVNEFSLSVVPEVRVRDVIDSEDVQIYRALAGGVTTARLLHGSANVIGGQDAVIKLKFGEPASKLLLAEAPRGVKFALGENVKRTDGRFPNTRLGVEAVLIRAFTEAQAYRQARDEYESARQSGRPAHEPRRDLRLEALADVLSGDLRVHCHCYRADEILMLLRVADKFGFKIRSLQHVLEGYKIAAEIADHGASCSTFSDWWAYKIEAFDAIPFNAALLNEAGAVVCLKSDSNELMRHLYQEAAKGVKYGGMSDDEALKMITLNGAKQLGLDKRTGSIEVGKDGDFAIFNGHPLNSYSRCEMSIVEGEVYFQRSDKLTPFAPAAAAPARPAAPFKVPASGKDYVLEGVTIHGTTSKNGSVSRVLIQGGKIAKIDTLRGSDADAQQAAKDRLELEPAIKGQKEIIRKYEQLIDEVKSKLKDPNDPNNPALKKLNQDLEDNKALLQRDKARLLPLLEARVREDAPPLPANVTVVQAKGLHLYPGMIDAATVLGLTEVDSARETHDFTEGGDFQPDLRASVAINPDSELIPVTRANGVTTVLTRPTGSIIAGQGALINLAGWVPREMTVVDPVALNIEFPGAFPTMTGDPTLPIIGRAIAKKQREEKLRRLRELFKQALAYDEARKASPSRAVNPRLEALTPYLRGQKPVLIQANRAQEIRDALKFADEFKLKTIISGGLESWKVVDELKKRKVPVIVGPVMTLPQESYDPYDAPFTCALRLHEAGVPFCIRSSGTSNTRNLPYEAAMAVSYGLPPEEGLKAVTLYPAKILGVADQLGSVDVGKRANLVLTNGDILQASTQVVALFIDGKPVEPTSKHTRLYDRYRERLKEVKEGKAPLGTK
jgi:imidazolonepropionase-like amidohydrolase